MTKEELIEKLSDIEWEDFEVKRAQSDLPKNIWETVSAFSNTAGGWIILGVDKINTDYKIVGVSKPEKIEQDFTNSLRSEKLNVRIIPRCEKYSFPEGYVFAFYIPISNRKPVYFNNKTNTFIRSASGDVRATQEEIDAMYRDQAFGTLSSKIIDTASIDDININSVDQYRSYMTHYNPSHQYNKLTNDEFLRKLQVIIDDHLTYSGLLFFGKNDSIQRIFTDFRIDYIEVPGTSYADASTRYTFKLPEQENIWEYYFAIFDRVRNFVDIPYKLNDEGFGIEDYPYMVALREVIVNLLMHSDYFSPMKPRIRVFSDRIEFMNPGALPKLLKDIIKEDITMPRNPVIAKIFRAINLAENNGFGIGKIMHDWEPYSGKTPEIEQGFDNVKVILGLKLPEQVHEKAEAKAESNAIVVKLKDQKGTVKGGAIGTTKGSIKGSVKGSIKGSVKGTVKGSVKGSIKGSIKGTVKPPLTDKQKELLLLIEEDNTISIEKVALKLGISAKAVQKRFELLKKKGVIARIEGKRGYWKILIKI